MRSLVAAMAVLLCCLAYEGSQVLAAGGESPKPWQPVGKDPAKVKQIEKLIRQLGDNDYYARQRAQDELARMRFDAFDALSTAASDEDLEIASRAKYLLRRMPIEWTTMSDPTDVKHCLQRYDRQDAKSRKEAMKELIGLPHGQGIEALLRMVRFERSALSKTAAATIILRTPAGWPPDAAAADKMVRDLEGSERPGAAWLAAWRN